MFLSVGFNVPVICKELENYIFSDSPLIYLSNLGQICLLFVVIMLDKLILDILILFVMIFQSDLYDMASRFSKTNIQYSWYFCRPSLGSKAWLADCFLLNSFYPDL